MHLFHVNVLAAIVAMIACMVIGALWYSPKLFSKAWMEATGRKMDDVKPSGGLYTGVAICFLLIAFIFGKVLYYSRVSDLYGSIELALLVWVGFIALPIAVNFLFEARPFKLYAINTGYFLANMLAIAIIMGMWK